MGKSFQQENRRSKRRRASVISATIANDFPGRRAFIAIARRQRRPKVRRPDAQQDIDAITGKDRDLSGR